MKVIKWVKLSILMPFLPESAHILGVKSRLDFLVGFPIQNLGETLAFADYKRMRSRRLTDY
jgi:hypothetical protein